MCGVTRAGPGRVRLLPPERLAQAAAIAVKGTDRMLVRHHMNGLGYFLAMPATDGVPTAFGHHGSGGSIAFADRGRGLSFALTRTRLVHPSNTTATLLADRVRAAAS
ncbi:hypothetical protein [Streptomyces sp. NPDC048269]|uniref:hypothetical protein n=1 Tax=Streptomyces sp. NPDC048269 TaxID=3155753 RepID=UPI0034303B98